MPAVQIKSGLFLLLVPTVTRLIKEAFEKNIIRQMADYEFLFVSVQIPSVESEGYLIHLAITNTRSVVYRISNETRRTLLDSNSSLPEFIETINEEEWNGPMYFHTSGKLDHDQWLAWEVNGVNGPIPNFAFNSAVARYSESEYIHEPVSLLTHYVDPLSVFSQMVTYDEVMKDISDKHHKLNPLKLPGFDRPLKPSKPHPHSDHNRLIGHISQSAKVESPLAVINWRREVKELFLMNEHTSDEWVRQCTVALLAGNEMSYPPEERSAGFNPIALETDCKSLLLVRHNTNKKIKLFYTSDFIIVATVVWTLGVSGSAVLWVNPEYPVGAYLSDMDFKRAVNITTGPTTDITEGDPSKALLGEKWLILILVTINITIPAIHRHLINRRSSWLKPQA